MYANSDLISGGLLPQARDFWYSGAMKNFEERLSRLEELGERIRKPELPLDEALHSFEEGIKLARSLEKDLEKVESRVEILMNGTTMADDEKPAFDLFDTAE
jgi:exodeoxyribonuclease VII small subunit